jgi:hypothetical protein
VVKSPRQSRRVISPLHATRSALESPLSLELMALGAAERCSGASLNVSTSRVNVEEGGGEINGDVYSLSILLTFSIRITFSFSFLTFLSQCSSPLSDITYPLVYPRISFVRSLLPLFCLGCLSFNGEFSQLCYFLLVVYLTTHFSNSNYVTSN